MQVKDVMTRKVLSIEPDVSVLEAVRSMLQNKISGLPVVDANGTLVGIVTEGDFLRRSETKTERQRPRWLEFLLGPGRLADEYVHTHAGRVSAVMTPDPYTVTEDTPLEDVVQLMEKHRVKRLPVVRGKSLVGIVIAPICCMHWRAWHRVRRHQPRPTTSFANACWLSSNGKNGRRSDFSMSSCRKAWWTFGAASPTSVSVKPSSSPRRILPA
jgi:CBS domain-containing protein